MNIPLGNADKNTIRALNRTDIELTTAGLKRFMRNSAWVGKSNRYARDLVARLKKNTPATNERKRNLAQYIAASVTLHANDGWSYLGRAVSCILTGDTHRALHLAYYAELRAAMSLVAGSGIGVFSNQHFVVPAVNSTAKLGTNQGTHVVAWLALEEWAQLATSGDLFAEIIRPEGRTLDDWFQTQGGASALAPQAKDWFMQWGMDLGIITEDRRARNESSYRPDGVPITWTANAKDSLEYVRDLWRLLEPSATSNFEQLDRHILRLAIERHYRGMSGRQITRGDPNFCALIDRTVSALTLAPSAEERLKNFLLRQVSPDDPLVFHFSTIQPSTPDSALAVISRAVLLLRLATGSANNLLASAGIDVKKLAFWWTQLGEGRGIWQPGAPPSELHDLWADVADSLFEVDDVERLDPHLLNSFSAIASALGPHLNVLASHERVGIWGLCPS